MIVLGDADGEFMMMKSLSERPACFKNEEEARVALGERAKGKNNKS